MENFHYIDKTDITKGICRDGSYENFYMEISCNTESYPSTENYPSLQIKMNNSEFSQVINLPFNGAGEQNLREIAHYLLELATSWEILVAEASSKAEARYKENRIKQAEETIEKLKRELLDL